MRATINETVSELLFYYNFTAEDPAVTTFVASTTFGPLSTSDFLVDGRMQGGIDYLPFSALFAAGSFTDTDVNVCTTGDFAARAAIKQIGSAKSFMQRMDDRGKCILSHFGPLSVLCFP